MEEISTKKNDRPSALEAKYDPKQFLNKFAKGLQGKNLGEV